MGLPFYIKANWKDSSTDIYNFLHTENGKTEIYRFWTEYFMGIM